MSSVPFLKVICIPPLLQQIELKNFAEIFVSYKKFIKEGELADICMQVGAVFVKGFLL